jgi:hypothetical protein
MHHAQFQSVPAAPLPAASAPPWGVAQHRLRRQLLPEHPGITQSARDRVAGKKLYHSLPLPARSCVSITLP